MQSGQYFVVCDDHTGTLSISFFTEDEQNRRIPLLHTTHADADNEIKSCLESCKEAYDAGYLQDYDDSGYFVAYATLSDDHLLVSIDSYVVYEGSIYDVEK